MGLDLYFNKRLVKSKQIGYFRKVNFLIPFFENEFQEEIQNLQNYYIKKESIEELIDRCKKVLNNHGLAEELLPTQGGFFFGSVQYDEDYFDDVETVLQYCNELLPQFDDLDEDEEITFQIWY